MNHLLFGVMRLILFLAPLGAGPPSPSRSASSA